MVTFEFTWNLYSWGDRAYEDCEAIVNVDVPDTWKTVAPTSFANTTIRIEKDTASYLNGVFHTDIAKLEAQLVKDLDDETIYEAMGDVIYEDGGDAGFETWFATRDIPTSTPVEVVGKSAALEAAALSQGIPVIDVQLSDAESWTKDFLGKMTRTPPTA